MNSRCLRVNSLSLRLFKVSLILNVLLEHHELPHAHVLAVHLDFWCGVGGPFQWTTQVENSVLGDLRFRTSIETCQFQDLPNSEPLSGLINIDFFNL